MLTFIALRYLRVALLAIAMTSSVVGLNYTSLGKNSFYLHHLDPFLHSCSHEQGYKQYKGFIIAQAPIKFTCRDFWKMIYERECGVVVMLSDLVENGMVGCSPAD